VRSGICFGALQSVEAFHQAGFQAGRRVPMQDSFLDGLICAGEGCGHLLPGLFRVPFRHDFPGPSEGSPENAFVDAVTGCSAACLPHSLES